MDILNEMSDGALRNHEGKVMDINEAVRIIDIISKDFIKNTDVAWKVIKGRLKEFEELEDRGYRSKQRVTMEDK